MKAPPDIRVLVVEDDFLVREMVQGLLWDVGFTFAGGVADGREAVEICPILRPDVILMDIAMSEMDGIEATRRIQEICPTPVVALTAYESADLVSRASQAGVGAYLVKPANTQELERAITISMARFHDMMEVRRLRAQLSLQATSLEELRGQFDALAGLVPVCHKCHQLPTDPVAWERLAHFVQGHPEMRWSDYCCGDCRPAPCLIP